MSRYLALLKSEKAAGEELTKPTQPGFVSSVSSPNGRFQEIERGSVSFVSTASGHFQEIGGGCVSSVSSPDGRFHEIERGCVSSVSSPNGRFQKIAAPDDLPALPALPAHQAEVVAMLRQDPALRYAYTTRNQGENVIVTMAIRDVAVADLSIPRDRYDGFEFMRIMQEEFS